VVGIKSFIYWYLKDARKILHLAIAVLSFRGIRFWSQATRVDTLIYLRLIGFTAGTLLQLFWMVVILGFRRQRNLERVFFFFSLALFLFYGGSLLALNAQIYYATPPPALHTFALTLICAALCFLPSLMLHLHLEYADTRGLVWPKLNKLIALSLLYAPTFYFGLRVYPVLASGPQLNLLEPGNTLGQAYGLWMGISFVACGAWEVQFLRKTQATAERVFHGAVAFFLSLATVLAIWLHVLSSPLSDEEIAIGTAILALLAVFPMAALVYLVQRFNFLNIGRQKNLVYAVSVTFLALLYLGLVRRVGTWLEPILPPEASAAILLFVLVIFFEPIQRVLSRQLRETAQVEMDRVHRLSAEIQNEARQGDMQSLIQFIERRVKDEFEFRDAWLESLEPPTDTPRGSSPARICKERFSIYRPGRLNAALCVRPHGAILSGEARAAIEFLCEQLPATLDLAELIEEKLQLERELSERERLALVGQTAASISHNLKNPLGSIKTILQVQLENPELPQSMRGETKMVLDEISRLSAKLNQLLQFSRPAVRGGEAPAVCDAPSVLRDVLGVLRPEADRRRVTLCLAEAQAKIPVLASAEALNDIVSNLVVNALEASSAGNTVVVAAQKLDGTCFLTVEDDGPGIPEAAREKILQPFFTTKSQGTGLGLAIVVRRVAESDGKLAWRSPLHDGHGTRFEISLPLPEEAL